MTVMLRFFAAQIQDAKVEAEFIQHTWYLTVTPDAQSAVKSEEFKQSDILKSFLMVQFHRGLSTHPGWT